MVPHARMTTRLVHLLATGLGTGYLPVAPGTWGTLVGVGFAALLAPLSVWQFLVVVTIFCVCAVWVADLASVMFHDRDPRQVVIDEIAGYLVAVVGHPWSWKLALAAFLLFRLFDVVKPPPCRHVERWRGGLGIVADDLLAGIYVNLLLWVIMRWLPL